MRRGQVDSMASRQVWHGDGMAMEGLLLWRRHRALAASALTRRFAECRNVTSLMSLAFRCCGSITELSFNQANFCLRHGVLLWIAERLPSCGAGPLHHVMSCEYFAKHAISTLEWFISSVPHSIDSRTVTAARLKDFLESR